MSVLDWCVLALTLLLIVLYGIWKSRGAKNIQTYLLADRQMPWYQVGLSVMATQASAITFLSAPGQAYREGMGFVQFYFGLPLAMLVICVWFIPVFHKLQVYTAYEYLEKRFDIKTRALTAFLFLIQRGLSTGITIYAPSIILSTILGLPIGFTTLLMGLLVISYTVYGGTKAVSYTQMLQMSIIFLGLMFAGVLVVHLMPQGVGFTEALHIAGKMDKMHIVDTQMDWSNKYNIWSGIIGGFFLQLSYFGTDQSQVGRYLTGSSTKQSRLGLVFNGLIKIPMQFFILLIGVLVFTFYQFHQAPIYFNQVALEKAANGTEGKQVKQLQKEFDLLQQQKTPFIHQLLLAQKQTDQAAQDTITQRLHQFRDREEQLRAQLLPLIKKSSPHAEANDSNYVFLSFVLNYLPKGLVGLLIAIIFLAAMGSTASGLNALASTSIIDFYKRFFKTNASEQHFLTASKIATVLWGAFCVLVALYASKLGNLIEAVNILGSLFYGTILGIFLVAFLLPFVGARAVFIAALLSEAAIIGIWLYKDVAFLWLNVWGCGLVIGLALLLQIFMAKKSTQL